MFGFCLQAGGTKEGKRSKNKLINQAIEEAFWFYCKWLPCHDNDPEDPGKPTWSPSKPLEYPRLAKGALLVIKFEKLFKKPPKEITGTKS